MITYKENIKSVTEYNKLYDSVGWGKRDEKLLQEALEKTIYSISAYDQNEIIAYGRMVGDKTCFLYIQDIVVDPKYQGRKIGSSIMKKLLEKVEEYKETSPELRVYVGPDYEKEGFYRKFGFQTRKEAGLGDGMILKNQSKIWKGKDLTDEVIQKIKSIIEKDGIIILPTDTVYGVACNCFSEEAISEIYHLKKRDFNKPICVLTDSVEKIKTVADLTEKEEELIKRYMPGALTIVVKKKECVPSILTSGLDTIGVRIPDNESALKVLSSVSYPLATTSANESGKEEGIETKDIMNYDGKVDAIIEDGSTKFRKPSTIIQVENNRIKVLREGAIKIEE